MNPVSTRLTQRISEDFPAPGSAEEVARMVSTAADSERIQAAIVFAAKGDVEMIRYGVELAGVDWRDVLVNGGLETDDWPDRLDAELGR